MKKIFYGKHFIDEQDIKFVTKTLKSNFLTQGPVTEKLENQLKKKLNVKYVSSCNSGTAAIHLALLAIGLKQGDIVVMPTINFIASYNLCKSMGAKIILADVDKFTGQMKSHHVINQIKKIKKKNIKIKAIINMIHGGYPENLTEMFKLKKKFKCFLIDDACHALGARFNLKNKLYHVGSCKLSDISTFSLHPVKPITSGEGGIVTTNNKKLEKKIKLLRSHGLVKNKKEYWNYQYIDCGFNYRLSEINASLVLSQLKKLSKFREKRKKIFNIYNQSFKNQKEIILPKYKEINMSAFHLFLIHINFKYIEQNKEAFIKFLNQRNIFPQFHYIPIYKLDKNYRYLKKDFIETEKYYRSALSLPIYYDLSNSDQKFVISIIKKYINFYKKKDV